MPEPKWVISMGACASCGGTSTTTRIVQGVDTVVRWTLRAGLPPRPEALIYGIMKLQEKIDRQPRSGPIRFPRAEPPPVRGPAA